MISFKLVWTNVTSPKLHPNLGVISTKVAGQKLKPLHHRSLSNIELNSNLIQVLLKCIIVHFGLVQYIALVCDICCWDSKELINCKSSLYNKNIWFGNWLKVVSSLVCLSACMSNPHYLSVRPSAHPSILCVVGQKKINTRFSMFCFHQKMYYAKWLELLLLSLDNVFDIWVDIWEMVWSGLRY